MMEASPVIFLSAIECPFTNLFCWRAKNLDCPGMLLFPGKVTLTGSVEKKKVLLGTKFSWEIFRGGGKGRKEGRKLSL